MALILVKYTTAVQNLLEADSAPPHDIYIIRNKPTWRFVKTDDIGLIVLAESNTDAYFLPARLNMSAQRFINRLPVGFQEAIDQLVPDVTRMTLADLVEDLIGTEIVE